MFPGGPADQGGLAQGDTIRQIDGQNVDTIADAIMLVSATPVGTNISVTVDRGGQSLTFHVVVGQRPPSAQPPAP
jgi:S1-C subfamily serine protease